jgi:hypothetical protein
MTTAAHADFFSRVLRRLDATQPHCGDSTRAFVRHEHIRHELCRARLAQSIERADRWYAAREAQLAACELRAARWSGPRPGRPRR